MKMSRLSSAAAARCPPCSQVVLDHVQAGNILIDHQGQVILADMGIATAMTRSHRLHEGGALDGQPQVRPPPVLERVTSRARWLAAPLQHLSLQHQQSQAELG